MFYQTFLFKLIVRVLLLFVTLVVLAFIFWQQELFFNQLILAIIITVQVYELSKFVIKTNQELSKFLTAIEHTDFSLNFKESHLGKSFNDLSNSYSRIMDIIKESKIEHEAQFQFLQLLVEQMPIGIITLKGNNEIHLVNKEAEKLLGANNLQNVRSLLSLTDELAVHLDSKDNVGKTLIKISNGKVERQLAMSISSIVLLKTNFKLITFQDIRQEIEQKEIEAWNKLIRIMTHEIMNSLTPVNSLTDTMIMLLENAEGQPKNCADISNENIKDIRFSLKTIQKRNNGMLHFIDDYRKLSKLATPNKQPVYISSLFNQMSGLMKGELKKEEVALKIISPPDNLIVKLDQEQIEQVIINLMTNSIHALHNCNNPCITLRAIVEEKNTIIEIADNGSGIDADKLSTIFIPFFSTKENGSGIGLSLSKQIMHLHSGSMHVDSLKNQRTSFQLIFPNL